MNLVVIPVVNLVVTLVVMANPSLRRSAAVLEQATLLAQSVAPDMSLEVSS